MNAPAKIAEPYDVEAIRRDFPILSREVYGKPLVYLDNGASAQKPKSVLDAIDHAYRSEYANVHRGLHFLSNAATDAYEKARETVRRFLNAGSAEEIVFTSNTTSAINTVAYGFGMPNIGAGRRDRALDYGAPLQHRAMAFHPRASGREAGLGAGGRYWRAPRRGVREAAYTAHEARRHHPHVECAGHSDADQGDRPDRSCAGNSGAR